MKMKRFLCLTLLMALVAVCLPAAAEEQMTMRAYCGICEQQTTFVFLKWGDYNNGHIAMMRCSNCKKRDAANWNTAGEHICSSSGKCSVCGDIYMKKDALHDMVSHEGQAATCTEAGWEEYETCKRCGWTTYKEIPAGHDKVSHEGQAATCTEAGWEEYETCTQCDWTTYKEIPASHDKVSHEGKAATCTEAGWEEYETCTKCDWTTYKEIPASHDKVSHEGQAATCTDAGWEEYETCTKCDWTTYKEIPALGHDKVSHEGQAATCTEAGWEEYETCTRCGWTTYKESPALNHDYQEKEIIKPTCEKDGYTLYACTRCGDSYTENPMKKLYHWYGEWTSDDNGVQSAVCRRDGCENIGKSECQMFDFLVDGEVLRFCPVCGAVENGERLELIENASAEAMTESLPMGEVVVRTNKTYLSLAFEYAGECTMPTGVVRFSLPAELLEGMKLVLVAPDGMEMELLFEENDGAISFDLDFTDAELPVILIRLYPEA